MHTMKAKSVSLRLYRAPNSSRVSRAPGRGYAVRSIAVMRCPEKGLPKRQGEAYDLKEIGVAVLCPQRNTFPDAGA
jgi:hypothetical protein